MSEATKPFVLPQAERSRALPLSRRTRDLALPAVVALSLMVHATVLIPLLFQGKKVAPAQTEIPVEIIQEPAQPPPKPPTQETPKPPASKPPAPPQTAKQDPPKPQKSAEDAKKAAAQARVSERLHQLLGTPSQVDPGIILPGESADGTDGVSYEQRVLSKLARAVNHQLHAPAGAATVTFSLGDTGEVASVAIVQPSGNAAIDEEAVAAVQRGAPFPPPPPGGKRVYTVVLQSRTIF